MLKQRGGWPRWRAAARVKLEVARDHGQNPPMPKLIFVGEPFAGRIYDLMVEKTTVGRGDQNTLVLHHGSVSQTHGEIIWNGPEVIVHDLGSANGTFIDGKRIAKQAPVNSGQIVRFGSVEARLELDPPRRSDDTTFETAVFEMRQVQSDQRREKNNPKPGSPAMTLDSGSGSDAGDHTSILTRPLEPLPPLAQVEPARARKSGLSGPVKLTVVGVAVVLIVLLCWVILKGTK